MSDKVTFADITAMARQLNSNQASTRNHIHDAIAYAMAAMGINKQHYIHFTHSGEPSECADPPTPTSLSDYLYSTVSKRWMSVEISPNTNEIHWSLVAEDDVPGGIRVMLMLINS